jgi:penicillin amidase
MEFQTHAAAGRLSEILGAGDGNKVLNYDRQMRRLGMVYGAKRSLAEMEKEPVTKSVADAYTAGVNTYISQLTAATLPFEYKLLGYRPEPWTNLKSALFLKYMSYDLAGGENDFEMTNARAVLPRHLFDLLYPIAPDSLDPIVSRGTVFDSPSVKLVMPKLADSLYFKSDQPVALLQDKPDPDNGSNNWAVGGSKTASGRPILCNDPHLGLNLPSLWFEMQIHTPDYNAYGVSFPGSPNIVIGFNDSCAFGFTNAMRDVKDYYAITFKDESRREYRFKGEWLPTVLNVDTFKVKNGSYVLDTVAYTLFGPVMYDSRFTGLGNVRTDGRNYAVHWKANDPSNELMFFYKLSRSRNYNDYYEALQYLTCPAQNCLFATKSGTIALWQQGVFPAKWSRQGDFVMSGEDSSFSWQSYIPREENLHMVNPERGFVSSANQLPADTSYPYYLGGHHDMFRGKLINRMLAQMNNITPDMMKGLQNENYNLLAEMALPLLFRNIADKELNPEEQQFLDKLKGWNMRNDPQEEGATIFALWYDSLKAGVWSDELSKVPKPWYWPPDYTLVEALLRDTSFPFIDNVETPEKEDLKNIVTSSFRKAVNELTLLDRSDSLAWYKYKDAGVQHLLRLPELSRMHLKTGGGSNIINATKKFHGPSWRMVVHLTDDTEAYGIYPGGQSGNPGSPYYDSFVDQWAKGDYYPLWVMSKSQSGDQRIRYTLHFTP